MTIHTLPALRDNYIYVLSQGGRAAVIDPGESAPVTKYLNENNLLLEKIFCTHHHWDHTNGVEDLVQRYGADVYCSGYDLKRIAQAKHDLSPDSDHEVFGAKMKVLSLPGHTLGQIALWFPDLKALFAGDTIFSGGCGRLFEGTPQQMFGSLRKIRDLPPETRLYFGHEYTLNNLRFVRSRMKADASFDAYQRNCEQMRARGEPTSPGLLATELKINPFLFSRDVAEFTEWREARDNW